ncbi:MAG: GNAT family N-acetyltransferase, partial [Planctomycetota bacterium]
MTPHLDHLSESMMPEIHRTFLEAFFDYAQDAGHVTEALLYNRAVKNGIDFRSSVGAFDGGKMVGFTLVGLDMWEGAFPAFDIATGIVKDYRGKGLARRIFDFALPGLKEKAVA